MKFNRIDRHHSVAYLSEENHSYDNFKDMRIVFGHKASEISPKNAVSNTIYIDSDYVYIETSLIRFGGGPNKSVVTRFDKKTMDSAREEFLKDNPNYDRRAS